MVEENARDVTAWSSRSASPTLSIARALEKLQSALSRRAGSIGGEPARSPTKFQLGEIIRGCPERPDLQLNTDIFRAAPLAVIF